MADLRTAWIVNLEGINHTVSADLQVPPYGSRHTLVFTISVDNNEVINKSSTVPGHFTGVYPITIGSKIAQINIKVKNLWKLILEAELKLNDEIIKPLKM